MAPPVLRLRGGVYCPPHLHPAAVGERGEDLAVRGVEDLEGPSRGGSLDPLAADEEFSDQHRFGHGAPQGTVYQLGLPV
jgi:hypothetical protein